MTLILSLPPELEMYLAQEAQQQGLAIEVYTLQLLTQCILTRGKQSELIDLLQSWMDEQDPEEQQDTGAYLIRSLDEDRLSERQLFPVDLKGITW
ncbi:MAG: hypothetical protein VKJ46_09145 [Leptolyngbyaceae bacterium]|nr:hypothetical protein [Leptolyngbyaceae bacterium]